MEKCIIDLLSAITNVSSTYIRIIGLNDGNERYEQAAENAFSAELYHQYKTIIENDNTEYYRRLELHYDLTKQRFNNRRPDLVLHISPDTRLDQRLYVEVKTSIRTTNYNSDFEKIILATATNDNHNQLGYKNAVFISLRAHINEVKESIHNYIQKNGLEEDEKLNRIYCIHTLNAKEITIFKFNDLS